MCTLFISSSSSSSSVWSSTGCGAGSCYKSTGSKGSPAISSLSRSAESPHTSYCVFLDIKVFPFLLAEKRGICLPERRSPRISGLNVNSSGCLLHSMASNSRSCFLRQYTSAYLCSLSKTCSSLMGGWPALGGFCLLIFGLKVSWGSLIAARSFYRVCSYRFC